MKTPIKGINNSPPTMSVDHKKIVSTLLSNSERDKIKTVKLPGGLPASIKSTR